MAGGVALFLSLSDKRRNKLARLSYNESVGLYELWRFWVPQTRMRVP